jgi:addiction module HigA family antidote
MKTTKRIPVEPVGTILLEEFIKPLGLTQYRVAKDCGISHPTMTQIIKGRRSISAENALRLGRYFGTTPQFWINLQTDYELRLIRREKLHVIESQVQPLKRAA